jgi:DNA polymerase-1
VEERTESYRLVAAAEDLAAIAKRLQDAEAIGVDVETTALSPRDGGVRLLQLATPEETFVIDVFEVTDLSPLKEVLENGPIKTLHNGKFDYQFLYDLHGILLSPVFDTMLAAQVLSGGNYAASYSLEAVAERYLDESLDKSEQRSDWSGELSKSQGIGAVARTARGGAGGRRAGQDLRHRIRGRSEHSGDGARGSEAGRGPLEGVRADGARAPRQGR